MNAHDGEQLKLDGMELALSREDLTPWRDRYEHAVRTFPRGHCFTSEDVTAIVGLPDGGVGVNRNNAVGAMTHALARAGLIAKTGRTTRSKRATSHAAELIVWRRTEAGT